MESLHGAQDVIISRECIGPYIVISIDGFINQSNRCYVVRGWDAWVKVTIHGKLRSRDSRRTL